MEDLSLYFSNEDNHDQRSDKSNFKQSRKELKARRPKSFVSYRNENGLSSEPHYSITSVEIDQLYANSAEVFTAKSDLPQDMPCQLPPEVEEGNIEYKRKLVNPSPNRFEHLVTQMKWRLNEGGGEAIYRLGVDDDGRISGLEPKELAYSLTTLQRMAKRLNATLHPLRERTISESNYDLTKSRNETSTNPRARKAVELLVRQSPSNNRGEPSVCVAVLGGVDAGKSTLIGVLTDGELDNGRGRARLNLFRHLHEVQSGRTSSLSSELLGFDASGSVTNYTRADGRLCRSSTDESYDT
ncbi:unnamed protein product [Echinostoma caproni]|uniref:Tr-type G domain-containing protein n=1 Tax=Echinostoma caproni TaxID=27848 RepID=A0A183AV09_9TREM|nr:unnamed protein product [Echinostoma caproni]